MQEAEGLALLGPGASITAVLRQNLPISGLHCSLPS